MDLREARNTDLEIRHPWETARASFVTEVTGTLVSGEVGEQVILDYGSGDCFVARRIVDCHQEVKVRCFDPNYSSDEVRRYSALRPGRVLVSQRVPAGHHDLVLFLDVLEHVEDDTELLSRTVQASVRNGGHVLITVPAMQALFSDHDRFLGHCRRYSSSTLAKLATSAGLTVERSGGLFASLIIPRFLGMATEVAAKGFRKLSGRPCRTSHNHGLGHWRASHPMTDAISSLMALEVHLEAMAASAGLPVPGLSRWLLGRKI